MYITTDYDEKCLQTLIGSIVTLHKGDKKETLRFDFIPLTADGNAPIHILFTNMENGESVTYTTTKIRLLALYLVNNGLVYNEETDEVYDKGFDENDLLIGQDEDIEEMD